MRGIISITIIVFIALAFALSGCKELNTSSGYISAKISTSTECLDGVNFSNDHVYAYRADNIFLMPTIQAGGEQDSKEVGVNIFAVSSADLTERSYSITSGSDLGGTGYIFYIPDTDNFGNQYISVGGSGQIVVTKLTMEDGGASVPLVTELEYNVTGDIMMYNQMTQDTICLSDLSYSR